MEIAAISPSPSYSPVAVPPAGIGSNSSGLNASSQTTDPAPAPSSPLIFFAPTPDSSPPSGSESESPPPADSESPPPERLPISPPAPALPSLSPPAAIPPSPVVIPTPTGSPPILTPPPAPPQQPPTVPVIPSVDPPPPPLITISPPPPHPTNPSPPAASFSPPAPDSHPKDHSPPHPTPVPPQPKIGSPPGNSSQAEASPPPPHSDSSRKHVPQPTAPSPSSPASPSPSTTSQPLPSIEGTPADGRLQPSLPSASGETGFNRTAITTTKSVDQRSGAIAIIGSFLGILALSIFILALWYNRRKRRRKGFGIVGTSPLASQNSASSSQFKSSAILSRNGSSNKFLGSSEHSMRASNSWFSYEALSEATDEFSSDNILGEGGFGFVYKGVLSDGRHVAVKKLKAGSVQGEREFRAEVETISRVHHRHLVSMVGYCIEDDQRLLIYDYVPNNTLHYHLHGENNTVMSWANRVKVAAGAARGLAYLHEDCQPRIIHRDIKSTNILLDNNFEAQVADFGLAKLAMDLELYTHVSTRVMGTFGYLAPEYASTGKLTEKSDVFSFGVVLLELITGRKPVDPSQPLGDESLVEWARPLLAQAIETHDLEVLVDPKLRNEFIATEMYVMIEVAAACVRHSASRRPKMSQIVRAFDSMNTLADLNNGLKPGQSGILDSREQSEQIRMLQRMAFSDSTDGSEHSQRPNLPVQSSSLSFK